MISNRKISNRNPPYCMSKWTARYYCILRRNLKGQGWVRKKGNQPNIAMLVVRARYNSRRVLRSAEQKCPLQRWRMVHSERNHRSAPSNCAFPLASICHSKGWSGRTPTKSHILRISDSHGLTRHSTLQRILSKVWLHIDFSWHTMTTTLLASHLISRAQHTTCQCIDLVFWTPQHHQHLTQNAILKIIRNDFMQPMATFVCNSLLIAYRCCASDASVRCLFRIKLYVGHNQSRVSRLTFGTCAGACLEPAAECDGRRNLDGLTMTTERIGCVSFQVQSKRRKPTLARGVKRLGVSVKSTCGWFA